jgi:hypothetical protein
MYLLTDTIKIKESNPLHKFIYFNYYNPEHNPYIRF